MSQGTPKSLQEAIQNGLCVGHTNELHENVRLHVKDFVAQKFNIWMLKNPEFAPTLNDLFKTIVDSKEPND